MANKLAQRGLETTGAEPTALSSSSEPRKLTQRPNVQAILGPGGAAARARQPFAHRVLGIPEDEEELLGYSGQLGIVNEYIQSISKLSQRPEVQDILPGDNASKFLKQLQADPIFGRRLSLAQEADLGAVQAKRRAARAGTPSVLSRVAPTPSFEERPRLRSPLGGYGYA